MSEGNEKPSSIEEDSSLLQFYPVVSDDDDVIKEEQHSINNSGPCGIFSSTQENTSKSVFVDDKIEIAVIGSGILSLPYGIYSTGLITGIFLMIVYAFFTSIGSFGVFMSCKYVEDRDSRRVKSYQALTDALFGKYAKYFVELLLICELGGAFIIAFTVIGDCSTPFVQYLLCENGEADYFFCNRKFIITFVIIVFFFPLLFTRKIDTFKYFSFLSILSTTYVVLMVIVSSIVSFFTEEKKMGMKELFFNTDLLNHSIPQIFAFFPMVCFSYACQHIIPNIYYEMKDPTVCRMLTVSFGYFFLSTSLYLGVGVFGFLHFLDHTKSDILISFTMGNVPAMIGRFAYLVQIILTAPLWFSVFRQAISSFFCRNCPADDSTTTFLLVTILAALGTLTVAIFVPGIDVSIGFTASLLTVIIVVVLPGCFMLRLLCLKGGSKSETKFWYVLTPFSCLYFVIGFFIAVMGTTVTAVKTFVKD